MFAMLVWIFMGCTQKWFFHWHHLWNIVFFLRYIPLRLLTLILSVWDKRVSWVESHVEPSFLFRTWSWICPLIVGKLADFAQLKLVVWRKIPRLRHPPQVRIAAFESLIFFFLTRFLVLEIYPQPPLQLPFSSKFWLRIPSPPKTQDFPASNEAKFGRPGGRLVHVLPSSGGAAGKKHHRPGGQGKYRNQGHV